MWLLFVGLLLVFEAIADILAKQWQISAGWWRFAIAILGYVVANVFWLIALRYGAGLTKGAIIFSVGSAMLAIIIGLFMYKEHLTSLQVIGIVLGVFALVFLTWPMSD